MKTWLFALLEATIAVLGLAAYFLAENVALATAAAAAAALLGIAQPFITAYKSRKLELYRDRQFQKSIEGVDGQIAEMLSETIDPPPPHRPTIAALLRRRYPQETARLLDEYDRLANALTAAGSDAEILSNETAASSSGHVLQISWPVADYLRGLAALSADDVQTAHRCFSAAKDAQTNWASPWLGWACTAYRLARFDEIREQHPHLAGVELLPYDAGDEQTFLELSEEEREQLADLFQRTAASLGNYYAIAEFCRSKEQIAVSQQELKQVA